jgi:5'-nucleotidase/UDP-sugar diphosphatase
VTGRRPAPDPGWLGPRSGPGFGSIAATTDVHSALDRAGSLAACLHRLREQGALIVDCGDFLEGSGYYLLGQGQTETALLRGLYDMAAPGNHGYRHHADDAGLAAITVCANITGPGGSTVWPPLRLARVGGRTVAVTAVMGAEAFTSILPGLRDGHHVADPARALRALHSRYGEHAEGWIVLSHSGFAEDLALAAACPFLDVVFSGHCHSPGNGPVIVGDTTVVKGGELGAGYSAARPGHGRRWQAGTHLVPTQSAPPPGHLLDALARAAGLRHALDAPLGPVRAEYAGRAPERRELLPHLARLALAATGAQAAMLNVTCLREASLGPVLTAGALMNAEPFGNTLTCVTAHDPPALAARLRERSGELVCCPQPLPGRGTPVRVAVTSYLAATHLAGCDLIAAAGHGPPEAGPPLRTLLRELLLAPADEADEQGEGSP